LIGTLVLARNESTLILLETILLEWCLESSL